MPWSRKLFLLGTCGLVPLLVCLYGCSKAPDPWPANKSVRVLVTLPAFYSFATNVGGHDAAVICLMESTGPHDYQPTSQDGLKLRRADLFFINGLDLDDNVATKLKNTSGNPNLTLIKLGDGIANKLKMEEEDEEDKGHEHHHGEYDPHAWLGIPEAISMVKGIRDGLKHKDQAHAADYDRQAEAYVKKLEGLRAHGQKALAKTPKDQRQLIAFHDSLRYFARSFDLNVVDVIETRAGIPADSKKFRKLVDTCRAKNVRVIAVEPQYPRKEAESLLVEITKKGITGAKIVVVDPLEAARPDEFGPDFYERKIKQNIDRLAEAFP